MTPLITEIVKLAPDPERYYWFDMGHMPQYSQVTIGQDDLVSLPYPRTMIVGIDADGHKVSVALIAGPERSVAVGGFLIDGFKLDAIEPFVYLDTPEGLRLYPADDGRPQPDRQKAFTVVAVIAHFLRKLDAKPEMYAPTEKKSLINQKRKAKGKGPVIFDWHTVTVEKPKPKQEPKGGTHASPRLHDRRGHWRTYPSGKRGWVKACKVGDGSKGVVFKDYKIKEQE